MAIVLAGGSIENEGVPAGPARMKILGVSIVLITPSIEVVPACKEKLALITPNEIAPPRRPMEVELVITSPVTRRLLSLEINCKLVLGLSKEANILLLPIVKELQTSDPKPAKVTEQSASKEGV